MAFVMFPELLGPSRLASGDVGDAVRVGCTPYGILIRGYGLMAAANTRSTRPR
jgi:hypothetical protein